MTEKPTTIDDYLAGVRDDQPAALQEPREAILEVVAGFAARARNLGHYPYSGGTLAGFTEELSGFKTTKGAIQFTPEKPLPKSLVHKLVLARLAE